MCVCECACARVFRSRPIVAAVKAEGRSAARISISVFSTAMAASIDDIAAAAAFATATAATAAMLRRYVGCYFSAEPFSWPARAR